MEDLNCNGLNATECLLLVTASILEQLKEDSSEFNWDPASFVVTLVIGIIAAAFAFFAIIQGFLAADPGRHKCSEYAIGTWGSLSSRKFDWSELRYRSIAQTPVIRVEDLMGKIEMPKGATDRLLQWKKNDDDCWNQDLLFPKLRHVRKGASDYFPATWLRLLSHTGLHHPELWKTNPQGTDYLPSDLATAPAYSTVNDLINIASIAAGKIRFNSVGKDAANEVSIQGEYMNLNFRSHPLLGLYAAIDQATLSENGIFIPDDKMPYRHISAHELYFKLAYSQGLLPRIPHLHPDWRPNYELAMLFAMGAEEIDFIRGYFVTDLYDSTCECRTSYSVQNGTVENHREVMLEWCQIRNRVSGYPVSDQDPLRLRDGDISILACDVPLTTINLFPKRLVNVGDKFIFMVVLSRYCTTADINTQKDIVTQDTQPRNTDPGAEIRCLMPFRKGFFAWKYSCAFTKGLGRSLEFRSTHQVSHIREELEYIDSWIEENQLQSLMVCRIMALAFTTAMCKEIYQGYPRLRRWPIECDITREERRNIDETINDKGEFIPKSLGAVIQVVSRQVQKLREYEDNRQPEAPSVNEYFTNSCELTGSLTLNDDENHLRFLEYMEHVTKHWEKDGDDFKYPTDQVQHYLDDLLIYRATLIYILMSDAADNSHILVNPEYRKLIPVI